MKSASVLLAAAEQPAVQPDHQPDVAGQTSDVPGGPDLWRPTIARGIPFSTASQDLFCCLVRRHEPRLLVPLRLRSGGAELAMFTTLTTFGTPRDVTLDEIAIELFYPANQATADILRSGSE